MAHKSFDGVVCKESAGQTFCSNQTCESLTGTCTQATGSKGITGAFRTLSRKEGGGTASITGTLREFSRKVVNTFSFRNNAVQPVDRNDSSPSSAICKLAEQRYSMEHPCADRETLLQAIASDVKAFIDFNRVDENVRNTLEEVARSSIVPKLHQQICDLFLHDSYSAQIAGALDAYRETVIVETSLSSKRLSSLVEDQIKQSHSTELYQSKKLIEQKQEEVEAVRVELEKLQAQFEQEVEQKNGIASLCESIRTQNEKLKADLEKKHVEIQYKARETTSMRANWQQVSNELSDAKQTIERQRDCSNKVRMLIDRSASDFRAQFVAFFAKDNKELMEDIIAICPKSLLGSHSALPMVESFRQMNTQGKNIKSHYLQLVSELCALPLATSGQAAKPMQDPFRKSASAESEMDGTCTESLSCAQYVSESSGNLIRDAGLQANTSGPLGSREDLAALENGGAEDKEDNNSRGQGLRRGRSRGPGLSSELEANEDSHIARDHEGVDSKSCLPHGENQNASRFKVHRKQAMHRKKHAEPPPSPSRSPRRPAVLDNEAEVPDDERRNSGRPKKPRTPRGQHNRDSSHSRRKSCPSEAEGNADEEANEETLLASDGEGDDQETRLPHVEHQQARTPKALQRSLQGGRRFSSGDDLDRSNSRSRKSDASVDEDRNLRAKKIKAQPQQQPSS